MLRMLVAALLYCSLNVYAESFAWTNAVGGPVPDGTHLYCTLAKPYGAAPSATIPLAQTSATFALASDVVPLSYFCMVRHYKGAVESVNSNEITVPVAAVPLPAPTNFRITIDLTTNPDGTVTARVVIEPLGQVVVQK